MSIVSIDSNFYSDENLELAAKEACEESATITDSKITKAVKGAIKFVKNHKKKFAAVALAAGVITAFVCATPFVGWVLAFFVVVFLVCWWAFDTGAR